jgi:hypothetical protein
MQGVRGRPASEQLHRCYWTPSRLCSARVAGGQIRAWGALLVDMQCRLGGDEVKRTDEHIGVRLQELPEGSTPAPAERSSPPELDAAGGR